MQVTKEELLAFRPCGKAMRLFYDFPSASAALEEVIAYLESKGFLSGIPWLISCSTAIMNDLLGKGYSIDSVDVDGRTALHHAVVGRRATHIPVLLAADADADMQDRWGRTPLQVATTIGYTEAIEALTV